MQYTEYHITSEDVNTAEILLALLSEMGFDTFDHNDKELYAYIESELVPKENIEKQIQELQEQFNFSYNSKLYEDKNWNEEWEKNFYPILVESKVNIRAPFHIKNYHALYEIIIEPRMSFGTGHHASTYLMIAQMLGIEFENKIVCDAGCGTGVLSIFAAQKGAKYVLAIDNNEWAYNNTIDNIALNNIQAGIINPQLHELESIQKQEFDIILANINKPIILENLHLFKSCLPYNGILLLSGILLQDMQDIVNHAVQLGFQLKESKTREDWICTTLGF